MSSVPKTMFTIASNDFYEPLDHYVPELHEHHDVVAALLPEDWQIVRKNVWFHAVPHHKTMPAQGWKIHLSATYQCAAEILRRIVPILVGDRIAFKFGLDRRVLAIMTGKNWDRGGSGKFVTIYPDSEEHFVDLIERLHQATSDLEGPYILSDRRYRDSKVLFYRYGGLAPVNTLTEKGEKQYTLTTPDGEIVDDQRQAFFVLPDWVQDPLEHLAVEDEPDASDDGEIYLKDGRYHVTKALSFSNSGGVYLGTDTESGETVVIKEGRPHVNITPNGEDAVDLLAKEYRLLKKVEPAGIAPKAYDFFEDWEHSYLVEEYLGDVPSLRFYTATKEFTNIVLKTDVCREDVEGYWDLYRKVFINLAQMLQKLHDHGVVFMDLSLNNIMVVGEGPELKFIDFEGAFEPATEKPSFIFTPGFISMTDLVKHEYSFESDYYGFGALMLSYLIPVNGMASYDPKAPMRFLESVCADFNIPRRIVDIISSLMADDSAERMPPLEVAAALETMEIQGPPKLRVHPNLRSELEQVRERTLDHFSRVMTLERQDRLFPSDPKVFGTNPIGLAYGASGVAYVMHALTGEVPQEVTDWMLDQPINLETYPAGLYIGLAGLAWVYWDIGLREQALKLMKATEHHPRLESSSDLFYGLAGWGIAQLKFHRATGDGHHLKAAILAGERLLETASEEDGHLYWPDGRDENLPLGWAHGASGVALFLLYLHLATGDDRYLEAGQRALDFDLAAAQRNPEDALTWQIDRSPSSSMVPYLRYGSAGVGRVVVRYYWLTGDARYAEILDDLYPDIDRKYAIFPGRFMGLAGIGELLLDLTETEGFAERAQASIEKLLTGTLLFGVDSEQHGLAFPGYELFRMTSDLGTGSAGIALMMDRYLEGRSADFLIDELFDNQAETSSRRWLAHPQTELSAAGG